MDRRRSRTYETDESKEAFESSVEQSSKEDTGEVIVRLSYPLVRMRKDPDPDAEIVEILEVKDSPSLRIEGRQKGDYYYVRDLKTGMTGYVNIGLITILRKPS